jgi:DNA polymerase-3 subunit epsilon
MAVLYEQAELGGRTDAHVMQDWCWLGTARDESELGLLLEAPPRPELDIDIARLLMRTLARKRVTVVPVRRAASDAYA